MQRETGVSPEWAFFSESNDAPFLRAQAGIITYADWARRLHQFEGPATASKFVVILATQPEEIVFLVQLAWLDGRIPVLVNARLKAGQRTPYLDQFPDAPQWTIDALRPRRAPLRNLQSPQGENEAYLVVFTSGSSGRPKAVVHSRRSLCEAARSSNEFFGISSVSKLALSLNVAHIGGFMVAMRGLLVNACLVTDPTVASDFYSVVPTQLYRALKDHADVTFWTQSRAVLVGGALCPPALVAESLDAGIPVSLSYGLSEAAAHVAACVPGHSDNRVGRARLSPGRLARADADGTIQLGGVGLALGYWRRDDIEPLCQDGWFTTEDVGSVQGNELTLSGRRDDVIVVGAEKIDPAMLENVLKGQADHFLSVFGVPDIEWGQRPALAIWSESEPDGETWQKTLALLTGLQRMERMFWIQPGREWPAKVTRALARSVCEGLVATYPVFQWQPTAKNWQRQSPRNLDSSSSQRT